MRGADIGVYGLGTMGSALALNLAEKGFSVAVSNREEDWFDGFLDDAGALADRLQAHGALEHFVGALVPPRVVVLMIPSGAPVDDMIARLTPLLAQGDTLVDAGNADFNDTRRRTDDLAATGLNFVGMGVSGGAEGARHGPSMMVGGPPESWQRLRPFLEEIAARFDDVPCVTHVGPDGAGHFVKTVHNGIEYADMQMIADVYGLLRDVGGCDARRAERLFGGWRRGLLASYLFDVTHAVLGVDDAATGQALVDLIRDKAAQKGTGRWTLIEALRLGQSANTIEAAVGARAWSSEDARRQAAAARFADLGGRTTLPSPQELEEAMITCRTLSHLQGMAVLRAASDHFGWSLDLAAIARIWRAGCIIRSDFLDLLTDVLEACEAADDDPLLHPDIAALLDRGIPCLRRTVGAAVHAGQPVPVLSAALTWFDSLRQARGTANLIQAQRDFFGHHGFERIDREGAFHGDWT